MIVELLEGHTCLTISLDFFRNHGSVVNFRIISFFLIYVNKMQEMTVS